MELMDMLLSLLKTPEGRGFALPPPSGFSQHSAFQPTAALDSAFLTHWQVRLLSLNSGPHSVVPERLLARYSGPAFGMLRNCDSCAPAHLPLAHRDGVEKCRECQELRARDIAPWGQFLAAREPPRLQQK